MAEGAIPNLLKNKSCVTVADIDKDGDNDLFVGGLADAKRFGISQPSYLLLNDGKGHFSQAGASQIKLDNLVQDHRQFYPTRIKRLARTGGGSRRVDGCKEGPNNNGRFTENSHTRQYRPLAIGLQHRRERRWLYGHTCG